jgi:hypothetical protein
MDRVRYAAALLELIGIPGALLYWFSIHPFVRFWRGVGARATVTLHMVMIAVVGYGMYLLRGRLAAYAARHRFYRGTRVARPLRRRVCALLQARAEVLAVVISSACRVRESGWGVPPSA